MVFMKIWDIYSMFCIYMWGTDETLSYRKEHLSCVQLLVGSPVVRAECCLVILELRFFHRSLVFAQRQHFFSVAWICLFVLICTRVWVMLQCSEGHSVIYILCLWLYSGGEGADVRCSRCIQVLGIPLWRNCVFQIAQM